MHALHERITKIRVRNDLFTFLWMSLKVLFHSKLASSKAEYLEGEPLVSHYTGAMRGWQVTVKRVMDIVISAVSLVILSPLSFLTAIAIKIDSDGPVHYVQERVGLNKRRFHLYKFRTMRDGADKQQDELEVLNEASGPVFKIKNDPRVTQIGRFLRKTSIDELPQLINVLKGDMSLVGPRPLSRTIYNIYN